MSFAQILLMRRKTACKLPVEMEGDLADVIKLLILGI